MFRDDAFQPSSLPLTSAPPPPTIYHDDANNLDDVFGSAPSSPSLPPSALKDDPSDIPRMRSAHSTNGYREGISLAKGTTIQEGFDEGYGLGATMGMRVGGILGTLEGILLAVAKADLKSAPAPEDGGLRMGDDSKSQTDTERLKTLVIKARNELRTEGVFARQYWATDGTWQYEVQEGDGGWKDVVDAHPLIQSWEKVVREEVDKVHLDTGILERIEVDRS